VEIPALFPTANLIVRHMVFETNLGGATEKSPKVGFKNRV
jgi:hypothetical protein